MNIRIGDTVRFISEKIEGKVTGIINASTVNVFSNEYGFEIPASVHDLVVITSETGKNTTESGTVEAKSETAVFSEKQYLAFVPDKTENLSDGRFEVLLVNDSSFVCLYTAGVFDGQQYRSVSAGSCNPGNNTSLGSYSMKELGGIKYFHVQLIRYRQGIYTPQKPADANIRVNTVALCKNESYKKVNWLDKLVVLRPLEQEKEEEKPLPAPAVKPETFVPKGDHSPQKQQAEKSSGNIIEIDLHANTLLDTTAGMESKDILEYQLDVFHKTLEENKLKKGRKIVFIHGKGDGVLRQRILWELQTRYKRFRHQDASFRQYGYGATLVTIQ